MGKPSANGTKRFAAPEILELPRDRAWLSRGTLTLQQFWRKRNGRRTLNTVEQPHPTPFQPIRRVA